MDTNSTPNVGAHETDSPAEAEPQATEPVVARFAPASTAQIVLVVLGAIGLLYFSRPVLLPVFLACIAGVALKPFIRWFSNVHIPPSISAAVVLCLLATALGFGFFQLGRPAMEWMNEAPQHMTELRHRVQKVFPRFGRFSEAAAAVIDLGATEAEKKAEQKKAPTVEIRESHGAGSVLTWTGTLVVGIGETLVLVYLLLASGDLFLQKLVRVMPTLRDKKRAIEISREIQQNISHYLFSVSLINLGLGAAVSGGLYWLGVPDALMWGMLAALLNFIPYFGPVAGVLLLGTVGLLSFEPLWLGILPAGWYLLLHLLESNLITPVLLGRRFTLNPVVIFVSLIFWAWLWGVPGAFLSVPVLVSIKVVCDHVPKFTPVSELLGG